MLNCWGAGLGKAVSKKEERVAQARLLFVLVIALVQGGFVGFLAFVEGSGCMCG